MPATIAVRTEQLRCTRTKLSVALPLSQQIRRLPKESALIQSESLISSVRLDIRDVGA